MTDLYIKYISSFLGVNQWQVLHCVELLEEGATIPFISRYRKERTGALDEVQVGQIKHYHQYFTELDKRKAAMGEQDIAAVMDEVSALRAEQEREDAPEDLARLPHLSPILRRLSRLE